MAQKKLEPSSSFEKYDLDADGVVSDAEIARAEKIQETEDKSRKHLAQLRLARFSLIGIGVYTLLLFMPFIPDSRIELLKEVSPLLYISLSGVVGAYMGFTSWMDRK
jgi:hypothetical protein